MNKDSIYQIIGYHGEYNNNVKKNIRKLLKENHPDNHGDANIFKIINEVKKELETNKVSYHYKEKQFGKKLDDIDYSFCIEMIEKTKKELARINLEFTREKNEINNIDKIYNDLYEDSLKNANIMLSIENKKQELTRIKKFSIALLLLIIITIFIMLIIKNNYVIIILLLLTIILICEIIKFFKLIIRITVSDELELKNYLNIVNDIKNNQSLKKKHEDKLLRIIEEKAKLENNLRFYNNLLNNR